MENDAEILIANARCAKRRTVHKKALAALIFSGIGILVMILAFGFQFWESFVATGSGAFLILATGFASMGVFIQSLFRLMTGKLDGSSD